MKSSWGSGTAPNPKLRISKVLGLCLVGFAFGSHGLGVRCWARELGCEVFACGVEALLEDGSDTP